ncbi:nucleotidyltransferase domain-containing protein [Micromonospora zamorensis]|uniref:nucleotidyltransferase domain-containing protein n=1 Tax=Micromonospora zamorensis TaxID=709883 RepID=UPI0033B2EF29
MRYNPQWHVWAALSITDVCSLLGGCPARWWLSGGWAIDHWLGAVSRRHGDIDVSTLRPALPAMLGSVPAHLRPFAAMSGRLLPLMEHLDDPELHNIWLHDEDRDRFVLQINLEEGDESVWRYRRDPRIALPWSSAVANVRGVPTGTPATQLLWKARDPRPQDEHDLSVADGLLLPKQRRWLRMAIRIAHPHSPWADDPSGAATR